MKKSYILITVLMISVAFFSFQHSSVTELGIYNSDAHKSASGNQIGLTGAPGESNCTNCHVGSTQDGSNENVVTFLDGINPVTEYTPGSSYTVSLTMNSNPAKKGFSSTALDGTNTMAGNFTGEAIGGTQDFSSATRTYVSHTFTSNTSAQTAWLWTWTAPSAGTGDVTFYVASNSANNDGGTAGDVIYLSTHTISEENTSTIDEFSFNHNFNAGYGMTSREVVIDFNANTIGDMAVNVVDMNGRSVYTEKLGSSELGENRERVKLPNEIEDGIYVVHFFVGNKAMSANIMVQ